MRLAIADIGIEVLSGDGLSPPGTYSGEQRILLYLEPPALVVGKVKVEGVELIECEEVDDFLDELGGDRTSAPHREGCRDTESGEHPQSPPPGWSSERKTVAKAVPSDRSPAGGAAEESEAREKQSHRRGSGEHCTTPGDKQAIALRLRGVSAWPKPEHDRISRRIPCRLRNGQRETGGGPERNDQELRQRSNLWVGGA
jgi:hypothetical protein